MNLNFKLTGQWKSIYFIVYLVIIKFKLLYTTSMFYYCDVSTREFILIYFLEVVLA